MIETNNRIRTITIALTIHLCKRSNDSNDFYKKKRTSLPCQSILFVYLTCNGLSLTLQKLSIWFGNHIL